MTRRRSAGRTTLIAVGINHPVFTDAFTVEQLALERLISLSRPWRENLNHQPGRAADVLFDEDVVLVVEHDKQIRLETS